MVPTRMREPDIVTQMQDIDYDDGGHRAVPAAIRWVSSQVHGVEPTKTAPRRTTTTRRQIWIGQCPGGGDRGRRHRPDRRGQRVQGVPAHARCACRIRRRDRWSGLRSPVTRVQWARRPGTARGRHRRRGAVGGRRPGRPPLHYRPGQPRGAHAPGADAGKHVVVEQQPFASDPDEVGALADLARANDLLLAVSPSRSPRRRSGCCEPGCAMVSSGRSHLRAHAPATAARRRLYDEVGVGLLCYLAIYNLKSLTALLVGPRGQVLQSRLSIERRRRSASPTPTSCT